MFMSQATLLRTLSALSALVFCVLPAGAAVYVVAPDGSGDFPTIQAALDAAASGDIIELTAGTFSGPGNRDLDYGGKALTVRSQLGSAESCIIDCDGTVAQPHRGVNFHSGEGSGSVLMAVTVTDGYAYGKSATPETWGGAVLCYFSSPTLSDCIFTGNRARDAGGGVLAWSCTPIITGCVFSGNSAQWGGGMQSCESPTLLHDCIFRGNHAYVNGGGFYDRGGDSDVASVTFVGNTSDGRGGGMACNGAATSIAHCTFYGNLALEGGGLWLLNGAMPTIENTIISFSISGQAVRCSEIDDPLLTCCDVYGNVGGDWVGCFEDQLGINGNIYEDPLFCDAPGGNLDLQDSSPCAPHSPQNPECDLIGAWPVGCDPQSVGNNDAERGAAGLAAAWPNPRDGRGEVVFHVQATSTDTAILLDIYDSSGRLVRRLMQEDVSRDGCVRWAGDDDSGRPVSSGTYFYRLIVDHSLSTGRVVLMR